MSEHKGWWTGLDFTKFSDMSFDTAWAAWALSVTSLTSGEVVYGNDLDGVLNGTTEELIAAFEALGGRILTRSPPWRGQGDRVQMVWTHGAINLWGGDGDGGVTVITTNKEFFEAAKMVTERFIGAKASAGRVYVLISTDEGPKLKSIGVAAVPLEEDNYSPEVVEGFKFICEDLKSVSPSGRLAILDGKPGTGKTFLIRAMLHAVPNALFVIVPAHLIPELSNPGMISALLETRKNKGDNPTVFLVEDADDCLVARDSSNVNAVSALLNLGDGILGAMMELRIICTTNAKDEELDEAVTRPGRLSRKITVGALAPKEAAKLFKRLTGKDERFGEPMTLAEVYRLARGEGWVPVKRSRSMGFTSSTPVEALIEALENEE